MLQEDKDKLKELMKNYSSKEVMANLAAVALETADDLSDAGFKEQAQDLVRFSISLEDLISGRPFLV